MTVGQSGSGTVTQTEGTVEITNTLKLAENSGSNGTYTLNGSSAVLNVGIIDIQEGTGTLELKTGTLKVTTISDSVTNEGVTLNPGHSPGITTVAGNYTHGGAATLHIELAGTTAGTHHDQLDVSGQVNIEGGKLKLEFIDEYTPSPGTTFDIINGSAINGEFYSYEFPDNAQFNLDNLYSSGQITYTGTGTMDSDGDGVADNIDEFDRDASLVGIDYTPDASSMGTLTFEDKYPIKGDYDFNDLVIGYKYRHILDTSNKVKAIQYLYTIRAMGAKNELGFVIQFPNINADVECDATLEKNDEGTAIVTSEGDKSKLTFNIFQNAQDELNSNGKFVNTAADGEENSNDMVVTDLPTYELIVTFATSIDSIDIAVPNNPYIYYTVTPSIEIHLPDKLHSSGASTLADYSSHEEGKTQDYLTEDGYPWGKDVQSMWDYPKERTRLDTAYPEVATWANSGGSIATDWYEDETTEYLQYRGQRNVAQRSFIRNTMRSVLFRSKYNFLGL